MESTDIVPDENVQLEQPASIQALPALPNESTVFLHKDDVATSVLDEQALALKKFVDDANANGIGSNLDGYAAAQNDKTADIMENILSETQQV